MTENISLKTFSPEELLCALNAAICELCRVGMQHKKAGRTGMLYASAALVQKLEQEAEKTEKRIKKAKKEGSFYSLS